MLIATAITPVLGIQRNRLRKSFLIQNVDGAIVIYVKRERGPVLSISTTDYDFRLAPGAGFALNNTVDGLQAIQDSYSFLAASGTPSVAVFETEDILR